jgi:hypothetical protein
MQPQGDLCRLELRPLRGCMGCQVAGHRDEDVFAFRLPFPLLELPNARLDHLEGMKVRVFANRGTGEHVDEVSASAQNRPPVSASN